MKDVKFYSDNTTSIATGASSNSAILFSSDAFYTGGKYTVYFPDLASSNASIANLAHVSMDVTGATKANTRTFGELPSGYLGTTLNTASYAGSDYTVVLPNEEGTNLQLRVDYTLESLDGSGETIKVHGARAYVPMIYTQWMPNYAYTYVFKISDNSNGRTSTDTSDPEGLFPITFDAVVESSVENTQSTITTVATPSITSYQMGHDPKNDDEYKAGKDIFIRLINDGALINDLNTAGKSKLYELGSDGTEVDVMAALNIGTVSGTTTTGRNGLVLNEATINNSITAIPRADGNDITVDAGTAASFSPVSGKTYKLQEPFFVLATQNPIEQEGTYPLPEAQLDRFMFNLLLDYPSYEEEIDIVKSTTVGKVTEVNAVLSPEEIMYFQQLVRRVPVPDNVYEYAVNLVAKTRPHTAKAHDWANRYLSWGAGPRASQYLIIGAKANALLTGKYSPDIEDVQRVAVPILRHRIIRNYTAEAEGVSIEAIIDNLK